MEKDKFYGLDHLRALAIILILLYHYRMFKHPEWIDTIGWIGWTGVDLFFVLSGFLISNQLFREIKEHQNIDLKTFFIKRFFRIIPPYFFTLMLYFCFPIFREREALPSVWKFISFTQNYGLNVIEKGTFSHAWSLCIEEQFYLLLPVLLLIFIKIKRIYYLPFGTLLLIGISISLRYFSWNEYIVPNLETSDFWKEWYMKIYYPTYTRFDGLAIGVLIGYFYQFNLKFKAIINKNGNYFLALGILLITFSLWFCRDQYSEKASVLGFTFVAISYGILLLGAISTSSFLGRKRNYFTSQLAILSYSIYLSHKGIIHLIQLFLEKNNINSSTTLTVTICFCLCIIVSIFYRFVIEKPSARIKNILIDKN
ncbi:acyltransferase [Chryseobacterium sp. MYb264]|uniref:acyltransferase family protein n=1 Tax=Chryseobacterium sp. MYb264 TaxID=2745153 RepID=UPI002E1291CD|nr:acyltransferase [Chryseobacterium sp. MYb264]